MPKPILSTNDIPRYLELRAARLRSDEIAREMGVNRETLRRFAVRHGLETATTRSKLGDVDVAIHYANGATLEDIAKQFCCSRETVKMRLLAQGVDLRLSWQRGRRKPTVSIDLEAAWERYQAGATLTELAETYQCAVATMYKALRKKGQLRRRGPVKQPIRHSRDLWLRRMYGMTIDQYDQLLADQGEACAICQAPVTHARNRGKNHLCVDHDHRTGAVRGLLCHMCNLGIGYFSDSEQHLQRASSYLSK